jgi:uncharacterized protein (DUF1330 family)
MPAYVIAMINVADPEKYKAYTSRTPAVIAQYGGKVLARGGELVTLEGQAPAARIVILEFPSLDQAKVWYHSREYQDIRPLRLVAATGSLIAVAGV